MNQDRRRRYEDRGLAVGVDPMGDRVAGDAHELALLRTGHVSDIGDHAGGGIDGLQDALVEAGDAKQGAAARGGGWDRLSEQRERRDERNRRTAKKLLKHAPLPRLTAKCLPEA